MSKTNDMDKNSDITKTADLIKTADIIQNSDNKKVNVLVLTGFGLNCDIETAHAFESAGAEVQSVHINSLISGKVKLDDFHILAFGGGFSWGDDHGAGVIQALKLKNHIGDKILEFVDKGKLVIGICNGFQTLVNLGLLPGIDGNYKTRSVALTWNDCGNFRDQWVNLTVNKDSPCIFTKHFTREQINTNSKTELIEHFELPIRNFELPIRHAQGKFVADLAIIEKLISNNQVVLRYKDVNPNGSVYDIAGICDASGHIFGLMPHPEAYTHYTNHPDWTRQIAQLKHTIAQIKHTVDKKDLNKKDIIFDREIFDRETFDREMFDKEITSGMRIFINGVNYMASKI